MDKEQRKKDTDDLYCAIGEFVVKFEHVCHAIQTAIVFMLGRAGLNDQSVTQILLAGLTADPLRTLFESLVAQIKTLNDNERKIMKNALNRFQELTAKRNDIVHTTWFIGWGNESSPDFAEATGMKYHKNKVGAIVKFFERKADDFRELSEEAESLFQIFRRLDCCFHGGSAIEKNFLLSPDGKVSVPPGTF